MERVIPAFGSVSVPSRSKHTIFMLQKLALGIRMANARRIFLNSADEMGNRY
jgi:hypothetical protein